MAPLVHPNNFTASNSVCGYVTAFLTNSIESDRIENRAFHVWRNSTHGSRLNPIIYLAIPQRIPAHLLPFNQSMIDVFWKVVSSINHQLTDEGVGLQYMPANAKHPPDINIYAWADIPGAYSGEKHPASVYFNSHSVLSLVRVVLHELLHFFRGRHPQDSSEFQDANQDAFALLCNLQRPFSSLLYPESCPVYQGVADIHDQFNRNLTVGVGDAGLIQYRLAQSPEAQDKVVNQTCLAAMQQLEQMQSGNEQQSLSPDLKLSWYCQPAALQAGASFGKAFVETLLLNVMVDRLSPHGRIALRRALVPVASVVLEWSILSRLQFDGKCLAMAALPRVFDALLPVTMRTLAKPLGYLGCAKTLGLFLDKHPVLALLSFTAGVGGAFAGRAAAEALTTLAIGKERSQAVRETWEEGHPACDIWHDARGFFGLEPRLGGCVGRAWHMVQQADQVFSRVFGDYLGANALFRRILPAPAVEQQELTGLPPANP